MTKIRQKYLVLGPGARKNLLVIESYNTWIPFNVLSRTIISDFDFLHSHFVVLCKNLLDFKDKFNVIYEK